MCEYCENGKDMGGNEAYIAIEDGKWLAANTSEYDRDEVHVKINYCPICGRELNE